MSIAATRSRTSTETPRPTGAVRRVGRGVAHLWGVVALILLWELWVSVHHYNAIVMPHPEAVASDLFRHPGAYGSALGWTIVLTLAGLISGMLLGVAGASIVRLSPLLSGLSTPISVLLQAVPVVAMIPVLGRLFGYTERTEIIVAAAVCFFPAFVLTGSGLRNPPPGADAFLSTLGVSRWRRLIRVELPGALPGILVALRLTAPVSVLAAMLAEFLMGTKGLGYLFVTSSVLLKSNRSWGAAVLGTFVSVTFFLLASRLERTLDERWT